MEVLTYSYRFAEEILSHPNNQRIYHELLNICKQAPLPVYKGKSKQQPNLDVVQQILNTYFRLRFTDLGWEDEPLATPDQNDDSLRSDFRKTFTHPNSNPVTVQIEVEFGNVASTYRNLFKFQLSYSYSLTDLCVLILPDYELSKRIDSGVAHFEKIIREIPSAKLSITVPILVLGLSCKGVAPWDVKSVEPNLKVLKGADKASMELHEDIVRTYIV